MEHVTQIEEPPDAAGEQLSLIESFVCLKGPWLLRSKGRFSLIVSRLAPYARAHGQRRPQGVLL